jgi:hypothetical protein
MAVFWVSGVHPLLYAYNTSGEKRASKQNRTAVLKIDNFFPKIMDIAAWFDDVRRMNKRQVSRVSCVVNCAVFYKRILTFNATCPLHV